MESPSSAHGRDAKAMVRGSPECVYAGFAGLIIPTAYFCRPWLVWPLLALICRGPLGCNSLLGSACKHISVPPLSFSVWQDFSSSLAELEQLLSPRTKIVAITHVGNVLGEV